MRLILTGGGTAGHVNPALAIAEAVAEMERGSEFLFIGREGGRENDAVTRAGIPLRTLRVEGLARKLSPKNVRALWHAMRSTEEAKRIIRDFRPDAVVGTGGYVCWPVMRAARSWHIPTALHESNAYPGLVTRMLAGRVDLLLLGCGDALKRIKDRRGAEVVGNPLRRGFLTVERGVARARLGLVSSDVLVVSFGGSIGAERLNSAVLGAMSGFSSGVGAVKHIHAVGDRYFNSIKERYPDFCYGIYGCKLVSYINDMPTRLRAADIVICRAGAMTLAEIEAVGVPSILIPSPNVTDDHQRKNAEVLVREGAAVMINETELNAERLTEELRALVNNRERRQEMGKAAARLGVRDAGRVIAESLSRLVASRR